MPTVYDTDADQEYAPGSHDQLPADQQVTPEQLAGLEDSFAAPAAVTKKTQAASGVSLEKKEKNPDNDLNYTSENSSGKRKGWWTKKKAGIAGSVAGIGVGGGLLGLSFLSVPLQFIHIAQNMHIINHSQQADASSDRFGKLWRWYKTGDVARTRLGFWANRTVPKIDADFKKQGVVVNRTAAHYLDSFSIDTNKSDGAKSDSFKSKADIQKFVNEKNLSSIVDIKGEGNGRYNLDIKGSFLKKPFNQFKVLWHLTDVSTKGGTIATARRFRTIVKLYGMNLHPFANIQSAAKDKLATKLTEWKDKLKSQINDSVPDKYAEKLKSFKEGDSSKTLAKGVGGALLASVFICAARDVYNNVGDVKMAAVIVPNMQLAATMLSVGSQLQAGQDVDPSELNYLSSRMSTVENGKTLNATDAKTFRSGTGQTGGVDMPQNIKDSYEPNDSALGAALTSAPINALCSTAGQIVGGVIGLALDFGSLGISTIIQAAAFSAGIAGLEHIATAILSPDGVDPDPTGPTLMNYAMYGDRAAANQSYIEAGGTKLSAADEQKQLADIESEDSASFKSQSIATRLFDTHDSRSLLANTALDISPDLTTNVNRFASFLPNIGTSIVHSIASIMPSAHADTQSTVYNYPFPKYGFSDSELDNSEVENPYQNADDVAGMLDRGEISTDAAQSCFGVSIQKASDGTWGVQPTTDTSNAPNPFSSDYDNANCSRPGDKNWLKLRMFIFDTENVESYACATGDNDACTEYDGGSDGNSTSSTSSSDTSGASGDSTTLAQQVLSSPNIILQKSCVTGATPIPQGCAYQDILDASQGKKITPGKIEGQGNGSASTGACSARTPVELNPTMLQGMLNIAANYKIFVQDVDSGHDCDSGRHPLGRAFDITAVNGKSIGGNCNAADIQKFLKDTTLTMSKLQPDGKFVNSRPINMSGIGSCSSSRPSWIPNNINYFVDADTEIHVDVGFAT